MMIDYNGTFKISGGILISSGSASRMTQAPSSSSDQNSLAIMFRSSMSAATLFHIEDSNGNNVVTFKPLHNYQSIVYSSAELEKGKTFTFYTGGSCTGENYDGLYSGGTFTGGTNSTSFTVSSTVTSIVK